MSPATSTLVSAFEGDPITAYTLSHLAPSARLPALESLFTLSSNAALLSGGELWSASTNAPQTSPSADFVQDYQAAATIYPPNTSLDSLGLSSLPSLLPTGGLEPALYAIGPRAFVAELNEYTAATTPAKKLTFPDGESFFYIQLIGAGAQHRGQGLAPALIRELHGRAEKLGRKVYLEASNEEAKRVYLKLGFVDAGGVVRVGEVFCDARGQVEGKGKKRELGCRFGRWCGGLWVVTEGREE
ncbi:hypothetical protein SVAN01_05877 [Stagonosporopsis vannaccii]|nr:hypothetical protein SVAN01_05877 [Stagonosporopsis vannaccii]